jgi:hypothetical protein
MRIYKGHSATINDFIEDKTYARLVSAGDDFVCNVYDLTKEPESMKSKKKQEEQKE